MQSRCVNCDKETNRFSCKICRDEGPYKQYFCSIKCRQQGWKYHKERCRWLTREHFGTALLNWDALFEMRGTPANDWSLRMSIIHQSPAGRGAVPILLCKDKNNTMFDICFCLFEKRYPFIDLLKEAKSITWRNPSLHEISKTCLILDRHLIDIALYDKRNDPIAIPHTNSSILASGLSTKIPPGSSGEKPRQSDSR